MVLRRYDQTPIPSAVVHVCAIAIRVFRVTLDSVVRLWWKGSCESRIRSFPVFGLNSEEVFDVLLRHANLQFFLAGQQVYPFGKNIRLQRHPAEERGGCQEQKP